MFTFLIEASEKVIFYNRGIEKVNPELGLWISK